MNPAARQIALERMRILMGHAASNASKDPALSRRQALAARRLSTKYRVPMPYHMRMLFCKRCKSIIIPGAGAQVRIGGGRLRSIRITCRFCGHIYRKVLP